MINPIRTIGQKVTTAAKDLAYSAPVRDLARRVVTADAAEPLRRVVKTQGLEGHLRRFTSETLPEGRYFAKLTITDWETFNGQSFRLYQGDVVVYGNEIEPPAKGHPLEYRNIIVTSAKTSNFRLDIDTPYTLTIGHGAFSTPQQVDYDKKYDVEQHGDVFYSLRGNTSAPTKLLITFPGFGPSTSRISYAVSYLKALTDQDLKDTLMVCFQDRYLAAGSYMLVDNAGRPLLDRVNAVIDGFIEQYGIAADQIMLFGASKGGSIALQYAEHHPKAHLVVAVPQMDLKYYLDKPFFKDNLFQQSEMHAMVQPEQLARTYFREGRRIDWFYTNSDEQSNHSLIEMVGDVPGLTKYRVDGRHGDVARASLPTALGIMRRFLGQGRDHSAAIEDVHAYPSGNSLGVQVRIDDSQAPTEAANWYLDGSIGRTRFRQILTGHNLPFVKYTSDAQRLQPTLDDLAGVDGIVAVEASGDRWTAPLPEGADLHLDLPERQALPTGRLLLDTDGPTPYAIVRDDVVAHFSYDCRTGLQSVDRIDVHVVDDIDSFDLAEARQRTSARFVAAVEALQGEDLLELMIQRLHVASGCTEVSVITEAEVPESVEPSVLLEDEDRGAARRDVESESGALRG